MEEVQVDQWESSYRWISERGVAGGSVREELQVDR